MEITINKDVNRMLAVQQAVFTLESLMAKIQQQEQRITRQQQMLGQLLAENQQLRQENEQLKHLVQELKARTKKTSPIVICPHLLTVLTKSVPLAHRRANSPADKRVIPAPLFARWKTWIAASFIPSRRVKDAGLLCVMFRP